MINLSASGHGRPSLQSHPYAISSFSGPGQRLLVTLCAFWCSSLAFYALLNRSPPVVAHIHSQAPSIPLTHQGTHAHRPCNGSLTGGKHLHDPGRGKPDDAIIVALPCKVFVDTKIVAGPYKLFTACVASSFGLQMG
ncbi:hypothetical protein BDN67DRAFT_178481 [Paxillus ammoniavirescens]|nr:hypothetical protein BDN67DRAFT_178481 [Paxillus ammoniavirescens]